MQPLVTTKDPTAVQVEVQAAYLTIFPKGDPLFVPRAFGWVLECFRGHYQDYQPIDARYHDLEHTLQGTLCLSRLLRARHAAGAAPRLDQSMFELGILAILLHDTGYLKKRNDVEGTGAKYTATHVFRSAEFAAELLSEKGFSASSIKAVQNMISCTGINANLEAIPFQSELEKVVGFALATSDLLGQMAAQDYIDKLPILYEEFAEAAQYGTEGVHVLGSFKSADALMRHTPTFWENYVLGKLERDFGSLHKYLNDPYPSGRNSYLERIEENIELLKRRLSETSAARG
jgi:hypothetical protein